MESINAGIWAKVPYIRNRLKGRGFSGQEHGGLQPNSHVPISIDKEAAVTGNDKKKAPRRMAVDARKNDRQDGSMAADSKQAKGMSPDLQAHIGRQVRAMFDEVADEPVPEHLLRLLKELDQSGDK